jgi:hypothetical protein
MKIDTKKFKRIELEMALTISMAPYIVWMILAPITQMVQVLPSLFLGVLILIVRSIVISKEDNPFFHDLFNLKIPDIED